MEGSERPPKRLHTEANAPLPIKTIQGEPWMPDGNIVLRAISKADEGTIQTLWNVHKSVLSHHCSFFRDMFDAPGGSTLLEKASEHHGKVPLVDMQDDAEDISQFLHALYSPARLQQHQYTRIAGNRLGVNATFPRIYSGILRLAHKYDAKELHGLVALSLMQQWPSTWVQWASVHLSRLGSSPKDRPDFAQALALAYAYNIPDILPTVFYDMYLSCESAHAGREWDLSPLDAHPQLLRYYIRGRGLIRSAIATKPRLLVVYGELAHLNDDCEHENSPTECHAHLRTWYYQRLQDYSPSANFYFSDIGEIIQELRDCKAEGSCDYCQNGLADMLVEGRQEFWMQLPVMFNQVKDLVREDWGAQPLHPIFPV